jgi:hypothetical protein
MVQVGSGRANQPNPGGKEKRGGKENGGALFCRQGLEEKMYERNFCVLFYCVLLKVHK